MDTRRGPGRYDRSQSTEDRHRDQRKRLVGAAISVIADKGYAKTSVDDVIRLAGLSRATFYKHCRSLDDLLGMVRQHANDHTYRRFEERSQRAVGAFDQLRAGITAYLEILRDNADLAVVINRHLPAVPTAADVETSLTERNRTRAAKLILRGVDRAYADGILKRAPDELTAYALICAIEGVGMRYIDRNEPDRILDAVPVLVELATRAFL